MRYINPRFTYLLITQPPNHCQITFEKLVQGQINLKPKTRSQAIDRIADCTASQHLSGSSMSLVTWPFDSP